MKTQFLRKNTVKLAAVASVALLMSASVFASGGYGGGGGFSSGSRAPAPRAVDTVYETGKAIFNGRQRGEPSLSYCVVADGEKVPVKRRSLRDYKKTDYNTLAQNLYSCDEPKTLIAEQLTRDSMLYVLYYLNKRHRLGLRGS